MLEFFKSLNPILMALVATLFTYFCTLLGSASVFFFKKINKTVMDASLGIAGGVMIAASFFSLINPALEYAEKFSMNTWKTVSIGFMLGGILLFITDKICDIVLDKTRDNESKKRRFMIMMSITIHNIPEGLVVGLAFGSLVYGASLTSALMLALGIGIQNFPEGSAISLPMRREGISRFKSFMYGQMSGIVEPIAGVIGALLVLRLERIVPIALSFAAGAMIYVVVEEIIPESQTNKRKDLMAFFTLIGFVIMMILDVALG